MLGCSVLARFVLGGLGVCRQGNYCLVASGALTLLSQKSDATYSVLRTE